MTTVEFMSIFNEIDPKFVDESSFVNTSKSKNKFKPWLIAASVVLILAVGSYAFITKSDINLSHGGGSLTGIADENKVSVRGSAFARNEIVDFVNQNKDTIAMNVSAEYNCFGKDIKISTKGYYHVAIGKENITDLNYLTLPICVDNSIAATIEVYRVNGKVEYTLNVRGDRWKKMNEALATGKKTMFAFVGDTAGEIAITSDGTVYEITTDASKVLTKEKNWYKILSSEYNTFSIDELNDPNLYVVTRAEK